MTESPWQTHLYAALLDPSGKRIMLLPDGNGWKLPYVHYPDDLWYASVPVICEQFGSYLGARIWTNRQFYFEVDREKHEQSAVFEIMLRSDNWQPPEGARWVDAAGWQDIAFTQPALAPAVTAYLTALANGTVPDKRPPWLLPGWRPSVEAWLRQAVARQGHTLEDIEQVKQWGISSILRIRTGGPVFYFKTTNPHMPLFVNEAAVTTRLAALFPEYVPAPLTVDTDRDWMLLAAFRTFSFDNPITLETRQEVFRRFAGLQIMAAGQVDALLEAGCFDRRLPWLESRIDPLLADPEPLVKLPPADREALRSLAPALKAWCVQLDAAGLPATLVHGDLHLGNTAFIDDSMVFFDWTDVCISHPFFDLHTLLRDDKDPEKEGIRRAYFEAWTSFLPMQDILALWPLVRVLIPLHHAVSYWQIVANLEPDAKKELDFTYEFLADVLHFAREYQGEQPS